MKAKFGMIVVDGRGKLGGHVLTKNRQGAAARTKVTPTNRRTNSQSTIKSRLTSQSQIWRTLTATERLAWNSAALDFKRSNIFGDAYNMSGRSLFMQTNMNLLDISQAAVTTPPSPDSAGAITTMTIASLTAAAMTIAFTVSPVPAGKNYIIEATRPLSPGIGSADSQFRKISVLAAAATTPANVFAAYSAIFGAPVVGKKVFVRATPIDISSGIKGIPLIDDEIVS